MQIEQRRKRDETIHVRIESDERKRAEAAAAAAGVSLSELVRAGLREATKIVLTEAAQTNGG